MLSVHNIMSVLEEKNSIHSADIYITPLDNDELSDEDSMDEDSGDISNLPRRQLLAQAEVRCQIPCTEGGLETVEGIPFLNQDEQKE